MDKRRTLAGAIVALSLGLAVGAASASVEEGRKIFEEKNCIKCHTLGDEKGRMAKLGGSLDDVGNKRDADWIRGYITNPKSRVPESKMKPLEINEAEMKALVEYMSSLKAE